MDEWHSSAFDVNAFDMSGTPVPYCMALECHSKVECHILSSLPLMSSAIEYTQERWGAGVETQKKCTGRDWGMGSSTI